MLSSVQYCTDVHTEKSIYDYFCTERNMTVSTDFLFILEPNQNQLGSNSNIYNCWHIVRFGSIQKEQ